MIAALVGLAWVVLGLAWAARHGPRAVRSVPGRRRPARPGPAARLGAGLRRLTGRAPDAEADRAWGRAVVASAALLVLAPPLVPVPWVVAVVAGQVAARRRARAAEAAWAEAVPDTVDLLALAAASGLTVPGALAAVAPRAPPPVGPALAVAEARFRHGEPLDRALARVVERGPPARPLVAILVAAHCDGAPVADPLARLADELRLARLRRAEERARQVPVRMLFPLVGCTLPAFVLVTVVPAVLVALGDLRP